VNEFSFAFTSLFSPKYKIDGHQNFWSLLSQGNVKQEEQVSSTASTSIKVDPTFSRQSNMFIDPNSSHFLQQNGPTINNSLSAINPSSIAGTSQFNQNMLHSFNLSQNKQHLNMLATALNNQPVNDFAVANSFESLLYNQPIQQAPSTQCK
jgi:hypothetical protein